MNHEHHENPIISVIFGILFATVSFVHDFNNELILFSIGLLKACIYGFAGGIFGKIATTVWAKINYKNKRK